MSKKLEDCKGEPFVTLEYITGTVDAGRGLSANVTRMLVGMVLRGDTFPSATAVVVPVAAVSDEPAEPD